MIRVSLIILLLVSFITITNIGCISSPATITVTTTPLAITETVTITTTEQATETPAITNPFLDLLPTVTREIVINYEFVAAMLEIETHFADAGYMFLVVQLDIENEGYESFNTNPGNFKIIVDNVKYNNISIPLENELKVLDILSGGRVSGEIAFEVPLSTLAINDIKMYDTFNRVQLLYEHPYLSYDIEWIKEAN